MKDRMIRLPKKLFTVLLIAAMAFSVVLAGRPVQAAETETSRVEGEGFDTPEEAVIAYAEAMKAQDMAGMLSTFAVETYLENYNLDQHILKNLWFSFTSMTNTGIPTENELVAQYNVERRRSDITKSIGDQMINLIAAENGIFTMTGVEDEVWKSILGGSGYPFGNTDEGIKEAQDFIEQLKAAPDFSKMEIADIYYAEGISENYLTLKNLTNLYRNAQIAGADGIKSLALHLKFGAYDALLCMDVIRYDGRWYNYQCYGFIGALMGLMSNSGGLFLPGETTDAMIKSLQDGYKANMDEVKEAVPGLREEWEEGHAGYLKEVEGMTEEEIEAALESIADTDQLLLALLSYDELIDFFNLTELAD